MEKMNSSQTMQRWTSMEMSLHLIWKLAVRMENYTTLTCIRKRLHYQDILVHSRYHAPTFWKTKQNKGQKTLDTQKSTAKIEVTKIR